MRDYTSTITPNTATAIGRNHLQRMRLIVIAFCIGMAAISHHAAAISFALDSIAQWGAFPRFCVNTYRWGDKFFNTYDSTYVQGSGKRFNIKTRIDSWTDQYNFRLTDGYRMRMFSHPSTSLGFYITYMAVSVGYDRNISKFFGGNADARRRFNLQFNCSLFAAEYYNITNDIGTTITHMGPPGDVKRVDIDFSGVNNQVWGLDVYYFFNHKHYSQGAAFSYSKIQMQSSGTLFAGLSISGQKYCFDFSELAWLFSPNFPVDEERGYRVNNHDYFIKVGYAYNWIFHPGWCVGIYLAPSIGLREGMVNSDYIHQKSFGLNAQARLSIVYNINKRWFFGAVGRVDSNLIYDAKHTLMASNLTAELSAGYRFDLWK